MATTSIREIFTVDELKAHAAVARAVAARARTLADRRALMLAAFELEGLALEAAAAEQGRES